MKKKLLLLMLVFMVGMIGTPASAQCPGGVYTDYVGAGHDTGVVASASSNDTSSSTATETINGSGLTGDAHSNSYTNSWISNGDAGNPTAPSPNPARGNTQWLHYDLGYQYPLGLMHVWNYNEDGFTNRGLNSVTIDYSDDGSSWTELGTTNFPQASGSSSYTGADSLDFGGVCAQHVLITINSNHGESWGYGLAEIKINISAAPPDTTPPSPDPATWAAVPAADSDTAISMTATTATDDSGVEYFFDETSGNPGGSDSGWQDSTSYTDSGLNPSTQHCYQIQARDKSVNQNATAWSTNQCATTNAPDTDPPTPDPMTWASLPSASYLSISMTATTATDPSGVEYYFMETSANPGGSDSGWQDSASYTDTGLSELTQYCYEIQARDKSINQNLTAWSTNECATTQEAPPLPTVVYPAGGSDKELLAAKEVRRYIYLRTDQLLPVQGVTSLPGGDVILVADDDDPLVDSVTSINAPANGFFIKTVGNTLVIAGDNSDCTLYGAYRYAEHLGCAFDLVIDAIPDVKIPLDITGFNEAAAPRFTTRGIHPFHNMMSGPDNWHTSDYMVHMHQLAKMGMNFILLHQYGDGNDDTDTQADGPEPMVWIGLEGDSNPDGTVNWASPAFNGHTHRVKDTSLGPLRIWGYDTWDTDQFGAGSADVFESNGWGNDMMGPVIPASDDLTVGWPAVHNRYGQTFNKAFTFGRNLGVKTAIGTEFTLTKKLHQISDELAARISNDTSDTTIKSIYRGIFKRIKNAHPLDYYLLWMDENDVITQNDATAEAALAMQALSEVAGTEFEIGFAGWDVPSFFHSTYPSAFYSGYCCDGYCEGFGFGAPKQNPITWIEEDWGVIQPQMSNYRVITHAQFAYSNNCSGYHGQIWRSRQASKEMHGMQRAQWAYGTPGSTIDTSMPSDPTTFVNDSYLDWANRHFGSEIGQQVANILAPIDLKFYGEGIGSGQPLPQATFWDGDIGGDYELSPGAIMRNSADWSSEQSKYDFVGQLEALRPQVVGTGNLDRYDYWLKSFQALRLYGEYGCVRDDFLTAMSQSNWSAALTHRTNMARLLEDILTLKIESITNNNELGEICNIEIVNWKMLVMNDFDTPLENGLGGPIPPDASPTMSYLGSPIVKVVPARSLVDDGEALTLKIIAMGVSTPTVYYRPLGQGGWTSITASNVARSVYEATIPAQSDDYEYYVESGTTVFPVTAPDIYQTVVVRAAGGPPDTTPPTPDPMTWASVPTADDHDSISMTATTASDPSGVEYYFDETTGGPGGTDSGWQSSTSYTDTGLNASTQYCYEVTARDKSVNQNETTASSNQCATTDAAPDTTPPTPDPMTWATAPYATGSDSIAMVATTATDPSGVQYLFDETSGNPGGSDSSWQSSASYTDDGLSASTQYCYQVRARDLSVNQNATAWSTNECATTEAIPDTTPPSPDPMTWSAVPSADSDTQISMTATTATDESGVEYYFDETSGNPGGSDSVWQSSTGYSDTGLNASTQYCYQVKARDTSANQNETAWSTNECATTQAEPDTTPPSPDPATWASVPAAGGTDNISMTATTGSDPSGVQYQFDETSGNPGGSDSGCQSSANYTDSGLSPDTQYTYRVRMRDESPNQNTGSWSTSKSATTDPLPQDTDPPTPNPATWSSVPSADSYSAISMTSTTGSDPSGVQYQFDETTGGPGATDSSWQSSASYTDSGLNAETQYCYRVHMRDQSVNQNTGSWSSTNCATTDQEPKSGCGATPMYRDGVLANVSVMSSFGNALLPLVPSLFTLGLWTVVKRKED